ncbi:MAG TPA: hypothetical protein VK184_13220 [Nostocaceae cyanobacterium]|nr:hypothetical protein [Nostocaceae cyanobacterium]
MNVTLMDVKEYENLYLQIEDIINYYEMGWIIEEVNNSIREGKIVSIEGKLEKKKQEGNSRIKREDYSPKEKLLLLLDAFDRAITNKFELEKELGEFLTEEMNGLRLEPQIGFGSDEEVKVHKFSSKTLELRQQEFQELQNLLNTLRQEIQK